MRSQLGRCWRIQIFGDKIWIWFVILSKLPGVVPHCWFSHPLLIGLCFLAVQYLRELLTLDNQMSFYHREILCGSIGLLSRKLDGKYSVLRDKQWNIICKITPFQNPMISTQHLQVSNCFIVDGALSVCCGVYKTPLFLERLCRNWMSIFRRFCRTLIFRIMRHGEDTIRTGYHKSWNFLQLIIHFLVLIEILIKTARFELFRAHIASMQP